MAFYSVFSEAKIFSLTRMLLTKVFLLFSLTVFVQPRPQPEMKIIIHLHGLEAGGPAGIDNGLPATDSGPASKNKIS